MKTFNPNSKHPIRAVQAWQVLVCAAMSRQTLTYEGLSLLMYNKKAAGVLDKILGHIAFYCDDNDIPILTSIVVGKKSGIPGEDIPLAPEETDKEREKVYKYNWYNIYPPSAKKLLKSFEKHVK